MTTPTRQMPLPLGFAPARSFANFLTGDNRAAFEALRQLAPASTPVYLWGPAGSGKTHLLEALALAWQARGEAVGWFSPATPAPWPHDEARSLVVLDDCDRYDDARQHEAFSLFVDAATQGQTVVAAGALPPVDLALRDDLRSRLGWGLVYALAPLAEVETRAALKREAARRGIALPDEVIDYLLVRSARDLTHLMTLLDRLDAFALAAQRAVTVPLLRQMLEEGVKESVKESVEESASPGAG